MTPTCTCGICRYCTPAPTAATTETHRCDCAVCGGVTFTAPVGYLSGATETHNYAQMLKSPVMGPVMRARGIRLA